MIMNPYIFCLIYGMDVHWDMLVQYGIWDVLIGGKENFENNGGFGAESYYKIGVVPFLLYQPPVELHIDQLLMLVHCTVLILSQYVII
ncbi:hypothetical protein XBI1_870011 [Xenorhabdus bovienii str. Intermedium]|uniref:Uncharacterized protein n=1 Tax=Xenorhabdus bovienii str. Intermedium TaxID=1379677 RepID=A0A077QNW1_XENBV|nr:hypothetical protein XBI1_870011 [Xenorhabdus bovienii str. Intermedium]